MKEVQQSNPPAGTHSATVFHKDYPSVTQQINPETTFLTIVDVERETTYKRSSILQMVKDGTFPSPVNLGKRATRWVLSDVIAWKEKVIAESRKRAG